MAESVPSTSRPVMVSTVIGPPTAPAAWANPLIHIRSGFSAVSGGRFLDRSAGSRSTRSTSTQSPALQRVASVNAVTPFRCSGTRRPAGPRVPSSRGQTVGVQKRGSGMSTTVSMPGFASFISGM